MKTWKLQLYNDRVYDKTYDKIYHNILYVYIRKLYNCAIHFGFRELRTQFRLHFTMDSICFAHAQMPIFNGFSCKNVYKNMHKRFP